MSRPGSHRRLAIAGCCCMRSRGSLRVATATNWVQSRLLRQLKFAWSLLTTGTVWSGLLGLCVSLGWLANFSIFLRLSTWARVVWSAAPWLSFAVVLAMLPVRPSLPRARRFFSTSIPGGGIALIHLANIAASRRNRLKDSLR